MPLKAKTQKEGGEEDNQSCEGAESIYRYRKSGASTHDFSVVYILERSYNRWQRVHYYTKFYIYSNIHEKFHKNV